MLFISILKISTPNNLQKNNLAGGWEHVLTLLNLLACCEVFHTKS